MTSKLTDKRRRQLAFLPYALERVVDLIVIDSEHGLKNPTSIEEKKELEKSIPILKCALQKIKDEREKFITHGRAMNTLSRDYMDLFQNPLKERRTGYGLILLIYMCQQVFEEGGDLSDNILDAVNMVVPLAENGTNSDMIDGMARSAERLAPKVIKELRRRDYLLTSTT